MTVSRKRKRPIEVMGQELLWFIAEDDEFFAPPGPGGALRVVSPDGRLHVLFHLGQTEPERAHLSLTANLGGRALQGRFRCPPFEMDPVTPRSVRTLMEWVLDGATTFLPVNYLGHATPSGGS